VNAEEPATVQSRSPGRPLPASRPAERPTRESVDPFAGDDDPWAPEDLEAAWVEDAQTGAAASLGFFRALFLVVVAGAVVWVAAGGVAFALYQLLTR